MVTRFTVFHFSSDPIFDTFRDDVQTYADDVTVARMLQNMRALRSNDGARPYNVAAWGWAPYLPGEALQLAKWAVQATTAKAASDRPGWIVFPPEPCLVLDRTVGRSTGVGDVVYVPQLDQYWVVGPLAVYSLPSLHVKAKQPRLTLIQGGLAAA